MKRYLVTAIILTTFVFSSVGRTVKTDPILFTDYTKAQVKQTAIKPPKKPLLKKAELIAVPKPKPVQTAVFHAPAKPQVSGVTGCGSDPYMAQIYMRESGCRTDAVNPIGACGLGQALPCSKMGCSLSDWGCQNAFFVRYAISVYGSTANAWSAWQSKSWW